VKGGQLAISWSGHFCHIKGRISQMEFTTRQYRILSTLYYLTHETFVPALTMSALAPSTEMALIIMKVIGELVLLLVQSICGLNQEGVTPSASEASPAPGPLRYHTHTFRVKHLCYPVTDEEQRADRGQCKLGGGMRGSNGAGWKQSRTNIRLVYTAIWVREHACRELRGSRINIRLVYMAIWVRENACRELRAMLLAEYGEQQTGSLASSLPEGADDPSLQSPQATTVRTPSCQLVISNSSLSLCVSTAHRPTHSATNTLRA
jgi:hypothetical protein